MTRLGMYYVLVGQTPVPVEDPIEWAATFADRRVALWEFGPLRVSTIFLGIDHNWGFEGPPVLFETMSFFGGASLWQSRCCTWMEAEAQHKRAVRYARTMILRHPFQFLRGLGDAVEHWMKKWDRRFLGRYGRVPMFEEW